MPVSEATTPPILGTKLQVGIRVHAREPVRQARRQKRLPNITVPEICILDPDGDIVRNLRTAGRASRHEGWACYHTELYVFRHEGHEYGIVGCAVGAAFAVLIAEELFASGCRLLLSVTSAGQIAPVQAPPYFVVIDAPCVTKVRAITTCRHPNTVRQMSTDRARTGGALAAGILVRSRSQLDNRCSVSGN